MMMKNELVPERRFEGFTGEWEEKKLEDVAPLQRGFDLTRPNISKGPYPVIFSNGIGAWNSIYKIKGPGVITGRSGSIGNVSYIEQNYWPHNTSLWVTNFFENYPLYIYYLYQKVDLSKFGTGSGVPTLNRNDVHDYFVFVPSAKEQQKIGQFFKQLDEMIALQQRKIDKTKALKSAYLAEMFPAEGEHVPKRRFEGFTESWRKSEFGDLTTIRRGLTYHPSSLSKTGVRVLRSSNINEDIFELRSDDVFVKNEAINIEKVKENDILITAANGSSRLIGKHALIKGIDTRTVHGGFMLLARSQEPYFINVLMNASWYKDFIKVFASGGNGSIGNIRKGDLENQVVFVPCEKEQQKIGQFFKHLDEMIATHQLKLDKLKATKQAYLHEMFV